MKILYGEIFLKLKMIENDKNEILKMNARNDLEKIMYNLQEKFQADINHNKKLISKDFCQLIEEIECWLYDKEENCDTETYETLQNELRLFEIDDDDESEFSVKDKFESLKTEIQSLMKISADSRVSSQAE